MADARKPGGHGTAGPAEGASAATGSSSKHAADLEAAVAGQSGLDRVTSVSSMHEGVTKMRRALANDPRGNAAQGFPPNVIVTSKYTALNFVPKFLMEQFARFANAYFLVVCVLQTIPEITTTDGIPYSALPLSFVLLFDAIVTAREDYQRHVDDATDNARPTLALRDGKFVQIPWRDVHVGDLLKVRRREMIPADMVFMSAHTEDMGGVSDVCYVMTAQLDGETNLKLRQALPCTVACLRSDKDATRFKGCVEYEQPNEFFDRFVGAVELAPGGKREPLESDQTLLRGCVLRNVDYIYGLVVYTGPETKVRVKQRVRSSKKAKVESIINRNIIALVVTLAAACVTGGVGYSIWTSEARDGSWYLDLEAVTVSNWVFKLGTFFLLNAAFVPVSLYVSMKFARTVQSFFMQQDLQLCHSDEAQLAATNGEEGHYPLRVRTMDLNDDLGGITHVFSDKTGTFTLNYMEFRKMSVRGVSYGLGTTSIGVARRKRLGLPPPVGAELARDDMGEDGDEDDEDGGVVDPASALAGMGASGSSVGDMREAKRGATAGPRPGALASGGGAAAKGGRGHSDRSLVSNSSARSMKSVQSTGSEARLERGPTIKALSSSRRMALSLRQPAPDDTAVRLVARKRGLGDPFSRNCDHVNFADGSESHKGRSAWRDLLSVRRLGSGMRPGQRVTRSRAGGAGGGGSTPAGGMSPAAQTDDDLDHALKLVEDHHSPRGGGSGGGGGGGGGGTGAAHLGMSVTVGDVEAGRTPNRQARGVGRLSGGGGGGDLPGMTPSGVARASAHSKSGRRSSVDELADELLHETEHAAMAPVGGDAASRGAADAIAGVKRDSLAGAGTRSRDGSDADVDIDDEQQGYFLREFLLHLALNHTIIPEAIRDGDGEIVGHHFSASSPDEEAFVYLAKYFGIEFVGRAGPTITLSAHGRTLEYVVLQLLPYNQVRKRMSVIIRHPSGRITLYCKGADNVIYERLCPEAAEDASVSRVCGVERPASTAGTALEQSAGGAARASMSLSGGGAVAVNGALVSREATLQHMQDWANDGLRTLCFAARDLTVQEFAQWEERYVAARADVQEIAKRKSGRPNRIDDLMNEMEQELLLQGATANEDKLQPGVPTTIDVLAAAGMSVWMLTGDKQETAINIGFATMLLTDEMEQIVLTVDSMDVRAAVEELVQRAKAAQALVKAGDMPSPPWALVMDDKVMDYALRKAEPQLLAVARMCKAVVCCRARPDQKARMVSMIRRGVPGARTLAIGDGANDVDMIQEAHVGVGIAGAEGVQAANASDFAIGRFRFLRRLLLVHGRDNNRRMAKLVCYMFYKNILLVLTQFWFSSQTGWSGQKFYVELGAQNFNLGFTGMPILLLAFMDRDVSPANVVRFPLLYADSVKDTWLNNKVFWMWVGSALLESVILFVVPALVFDVADQSGAAPSVFELGTVVMFSLVAVANVRVALEMRLHHWVFQAAVLFSVLSLFPFFAVFDSFNADRMRGGFARLLGSGGFWGTCILCVVATTVRSYAWKVFTRHFRPGLRHIVREVQHLTQGYAPLDDWCAEQRMRRDVGDAVAERLLGAKSDTSQTPGSTHGKHASAVAPVGAGEDRKAPAEGRAPADAWGRTRSGRENDAAPETKADGGAPRVTRGLSSGAEDSDGSLARGSSGRLSRLPFAQRAHRYWTSLRAAQRMAFNKSRYTGSAFTGMDERSAEAMVRRMSLVGDQSEMGAIGHASDPDTALGEYCKTISPAGTLRGGAGGGAEDSTYDSEGPGGDSFVLPSRRNVKTQAQSKT